MTIEIKVPDIGDFKDVPIIEILVKAGDVIKPEDPLIVLESDKATMEVPSPAAGLVKELKVKVGERIGEGAVILLLEAASEAAAPPAAEAPSPPKRRRRLHKPPTSTPKSWCSAPGPAAIPPPSAPPISARKWCWSNAGRCSAASASMSAASLPRLCFTPPK